MTGEKTFHRLLKPLEIYLLRIKQELRLKTKYEEIAQKPLLAQISNNAIMSVAHSLFVSGWQPMIGWTAGFLVLLYYAPQLIITTVA